MVFMAKFKCDRKSVVELEKQVIDLFKEGGINMVYVIEGDLTIGFYNLPSNKGAINTIFGKTKTISVDGKPYKAIIGVCDMDENFEGYKFLQDLLSHLMAEYDN